MGSRGDKSHSTPQMENDKDLSSFSYPRLITFHNTDNAPFLLDMRRLDPSLRSRG